MESFESYAIHIPQSSLTVWTDSDAVYPHLTACVPSRWEHCDSAQHCKNAYREELEKRVRELVSGTAPAPALPDGCTAPGVEAPGRHELRVVADSDDLEKLASMGMASTSGVEQSHASVICDTSDSDAGVACTPEAVVQMFDAWLIKDLPPPGSSFTVFQVGNSQPSSELAVEISIPNFSSARMVAYILQQRQVLLARSPRTVVKNASAIVEALRWASGRANERPGRHRYFLLSDLRQYTVGGFNLERHVPAEREFLAGLRRDGLVARLDGAVVSGCGMHLKPDQEDAEQIRRIWAHALVVMGVKEGDIHIQESCPAPL